MQALLDLNLSYEQLRSLAIETLRTSGTGDQWSGFFINMAKRAVELNHAENPLVKVGLPLNSDFTLSRKDRGQVHDVLCDLVIEGIVRPGLGDGTNENLPFFHITEYGNQQLAGTSPTAYDPDGYLQRLKSEIPGIDQITVTYLEESLHTFRIGCLLSATITLGCASEKTFSDLVGVYTDALPEGRQSKFRNNTQGRLLSRQYDEFMKTYKGHLTGILPGDVKEGLDNALYGVFHHIRNYRNDAGHPTGKVISREEVFANLVVFPTYLRSLYRLIDWLNENAPLS